MGDLLIVLALENRVCWIACALRLTHNKINAEKRVRENRIYGVQKQKSYWGWVNSGKLSCITFLSHTCNSYCCELFFSLCFEAFFKTSSLQVTQMNSLTDEEWDMSGNAVNVSYLWVLICHHFYVFLTVFSKSWKPYWLTVIYSY